MPLLVLILIVVIVIGLVRVARLTRRIERLERTIEENSPHDRLTDVADRILRLETILRDIERASPTTFVPVRPPAPIAPGVPSGALEDAELDPSIPPAVLLDREAPDSSAVPRVSMALDVFDVSNLPDVPDEPEEPGAPGVPSVPDQWEVVVGGNWLNKLGVVTFVIGVALLLGYSMTHVGPLGRVGMGYALSVLMLGAGVVLERRRPAYATYAYGLIAGGWAGTYFTTFAAHAVDAARVVDNEWVATGALVLVACGMVGHSLRYRSQTVTALSYLAAYAALAITPLSDFALVASVLLSASLLVVAERFGWSAVATLGVASTYGIIGLRGVIFTGDRAGEGLMTHYAALSASWVAFEAADIVGLRSRRREGAAPPPLFVLNFIGVMGAAVVRLPLDNLGRVSGFLAFAGAAYLVSAIVRARLLARAGAEAPHAASGAHQGAVAMAAFLFVGAIGARYEPPQATIEWLLETELLFAVGLTLGDRVIRLIGSVVGVLVTLTTLGLLADAWTGVSTPLTSALSTPIAVLVIVFWYINRELLRARHVSPAVLEWGYTPSAAWLLVLVLLMKSPSAYQGLNISVFGFALLMAGLWLGSEYRYQAYVATAVGAILTCTYFLFVVARGDVISDTWIVLSASTAIAYASAALLVRTPISARPTADRRLAAVACLCIGTASLGLLEWRRLPDLTIGPAWMFTAQMLLTVGLWRDAAAIRAQAYLLMFAAIARTAPPLLAGDPLSMVAGIQSGVVIGLLYGSSIAARRPAQAGGQGAEIEEKFRVSMALAATLLLSALIVCQVRPTMITLALALQGTLLLAAGFPLRERVMRLSGLGLFLLCIVKLFAHDLQELEPLARILSFVVLGLVLLAVSWTYTRFRERIRKLL